MGWLTVLGATNLLGATPQVVVESSLAHQHTTHGSSKPVKAPFTLVYCGYYWTRIVVSRINNELGIASYSIISRLQTMSNNTCSTLAQCVCLSSKTRWAPLFSKCCKHSQMFYFIWKYAWLKQVAIQIWNVSLPAAVCYFLYHSESNACWPSTYNEDTHVRKG